MPPGALIYSEGWCWWPRGREEGSKCSEQDVTVTRQERRLQAPGVVSEKATLGRGVGWEVGGPGVCVCVCAHTARTLAECVLKMGDL